MEEVNAGLKAMEDELQGLRILGAGRVSWKGGFSLPLGASGEGVGWDGFMSRERAPR